MANKIKNVGVVGCGLMGAGITQVCAQAGYATTVVEANDAFLEKGLQRIHASLAKGVEKGKIEQSAMEATLGNIEGTCDVARLDSADLVIEAIIENVDEKQELFRNLDQITPAHALLATNTSSVTVMELAAVTERPDRVLGLHFFNPVPLMKLVEVVRAITTSDETVTAGREFVTSLGKEPVTTPDTTAFVVNRLLVPYLLDAVRILEQGGVTREEIDKAMQLGCGYPMGPLTLLDFVGIDTTYYIANIMFDEFKEARFAPPPLMKRMVMAGHFGRKSGKGFYDYK